MKPGYFDESMSADGYPWHDFALNHNLVHHELLELPRLVEVAATLPAAQLEYNLGDLAIGQSSKNAPMNGLSAAETVARIEECRSWMVMKNVEILPDYRQLMNACLNELGGILPGMLDDLHLREAFVFVSSPGSVTPFHIDPEHNFLLQVRGSKDIRIWPADDREVLPDTAIENTLGGGEVTRSVPYSETFDARATKYTLTPGKGVYVPFHAPHWVSNGDQVSISFSITYRSAFSRRTSAIYALNKRLRRMGLRPTEVGRRPRLDAMKYAAFRGYRGLKTLIS